MREHATGQLKAGTVDYEPQELLKSRFLHPYNM